MKVYNKKSFHQKTNLDSKGYMNLSSWGITGLIIAFILLCFSMFGNLFATHSSTEQRSELSRIKPFVSAVSMGDFSVFLSDVKNVIIYENGIYQVVDSVKYLDGFKKIEFQYKGESYIYQNVDNNATIFKNGSQLSTQKSIVWSSEYPMGTDLLGRCFYSRVVDGLKITMIVSITTMLITYIVGLMYGCLAGCIGGIVDMIMIRFLDILNVIPQLLVIILVSTFINSSILGIIIALSSVSWVRLARIIRGATWNYKNMEYCWVLKRLGASRMWIIRKHIIPNMSKLAMFNTIAILPTIVMSESSLSFLGIGLKYPNASLGTLCSGSLDYIQNSAYLTVMPILILILFLLSICFIAQGVKKLHD